MEGLSPGQLAFATDPAPQVAARCTRRSGKSRTALRAKAVHTAITTPGARILYVNQTFPECERIAWIGTNRDGLLSLNEDFRLRGHPHGGKLRLTFPNGSIIECCAGDNERQLAKARGGAFHLVLIDESQKLPHLSDFVIDILGPAMADFGGQIVLLGTPSRDCTGFFYDITRDDWADVPETERVKGWNAHHWTVLENPWFGDTEEERYARTIQRALDTTGLPIDAPSIQREWFGRWVKEDANFVYDVHKVPEADLCWGIHRSLPNGFPDIEANISALPKIEGAWRYALGADLGYSPDPFAITIWAYSDKHPVAYEVASWKKGGLIPDEQAETLMALHEKYRFTVMVADAGGGGKAIVAGWQEGWLDRYPIPIEEAKKTDKTTHIEFVNNDLRTGKLRLLSGSPLHEEMRVLSWKMSNSTRLIEDPKHDNHCCDAGLYAHRHALHHRYTEPVPEPEYGTPEYYERESALLELGVLKDIKEGRYG